MLDTELYAIEIETDERSSARRELFYSFEDAFNNRMRYANWYMPYGDVYIQRLDKSGVRVIERWHINEKGETVSHYDF